MRDDRRLSRGVHRRFSSQEWPTSVEEGNVIGPVMSPSSGIQEAAAPSAAPGAASAQPPSVELERQRLARDLHDVVGQALTAVRLAIIALGRDGLSEESRAPLEACLSQIDDALRAVRAFVRDLRSSVVADLDLETAARSAVARHAALGGFRSRVRIGTLPTPLPAVIAATCHRVLEEALTNVDRHADARLVEVCLRRAGRWLELVIADDGRGFDVVQATLAGSSGASSGLWGMRTQVVALGGELDIRSRPGAGVRIRARLPLVGMAGTASAPGGGRRSRAGSASGAVRLVEPLRAPAAPRSDGGDAEPEAILPRSRNGASTLALAGGTRR